MCHLCFASSWSGCGTADGKAPPPPRLAQGQQRLAAAAARPSPSTRRPKPSSPLPLHAARGCSELPLLAPLRPTVVRRMLLRRRPARLQSLPKSKSRRYRPSSRSSPLPTWTSARSSQGPFRTFLASASSYGPCFRRTARSGGLALKEEADFSAPSSSAQGGGVVGTAATWPHFLSPYLSLSLPRSGNHVIMTNSGFRMLIRAAKLMERCETAVRFHVSSSLRLWPFVFFLPRHATVLAGPPARCCIFPASALTLFRPGRWAILSFAD